MTRHEKRAIRVRAAISGLTSGDILTRQKAARILDKLGDDSPEVLALLTASLQDTSLKVRWDAALALVSLGAETEAVVPVLVQSLRSKSASRREKGAHALGRFGLQQASVTRHAIVSALAAALKDTVAGVRRASIVALGAVALNLPEETLPEISCTARILYTAITKAIRDQDSVVCSEAIGAIGLAKFAAQDKARILIRALDHGDPQVRARAAACLRHIDRTAGDDKDSCVIALIRVLRLDDDDTVRASAAETLGKLGAQEAIPALKAALNGGPQPRRAAAIALTRLPYEDASLPEYLVPALVESLQCGDANVRRTVARALPRLGNHAGQALPALLEAFRREGPELVEEIAAALGRIAGECSARFIDAGEPWTFQQRLLPLLLQRLRDPDPARRRASLSVLFHLRKNQVKEALSDILKATTDEDPGVRLKAIAIVENTQVFLPDYGICIPVFERAAQDTDESIRTQSWWALSILGIPSGNLSAFIELAMREKDPSIRKYALQALTDADQNTQQIVSSFLSLEDNSRLRWHAATLLTGVDMDYSIILGPASDGLARLGKATYEVTDLLVLFDVIGRVFDTVGAKSFRQLEKILEEMKNRGEVDATLRTSQAYIRISVGELEKYFSSYFGRPVKLIDNRPGKKGGFTADALAALEETRRYFTLGEREIG